jgi:ABC-type transporter lipoprotein component MlaA/pimeloyl-ACP methyl ester carboxylesterase
MKFPFRSLRLAALASLTATLIQAQSSSQPGSSPSATGSNAIVLPPTFSDPIEGVNRTIWNIDKAFAIDAVKPFGTGYRFVVPKPVRDGIGNAGRNLIYPGRFVNELLQGDWKSANDETARLFVNTVIGVGGFFDVATTWHIPKRDANFGQTFKQWGIQPSIFLMLPIFGPSDVRDTTGLIADYFANPLSYFYPFYYIGTGVTANNLSDSIEESVRFIQTQPDSYSLLQGAWSFSRENRKVDLTLKGSQDQASLETLQSFFFSSRNPKFLEHAKTRSVLIPATGKKLPFTFWLQPHEAPMVYLVPGFGAHRLAGNEMGLAELLVSNGFSVVSISSCFHPEFMETASKMDLPGYPPLSAQEVHEALTEIDRKLDADYPHRLGTRAVMGYSMGAFQAMVLAATEKTNESNLLKFQRFVAIDLPVSLRYAVTNLDGFYQAPLAWPVEERQANIENIFLKVAALASQPPEDWSRLPFNAIESKFLIGIGLRLSLRDIIWSSQYRHNEGVLQTPLKKSKRRAAYDEIMQYSFYDYVVKFVTPYDKTLGIDLSIPDVVNRGTDLRSYTPRLQANPNIRLILNRNDIVLNSTDLTWVEATFNPTQVTEFQEGGHLGNLGQPAVQQAILKALDGLGAQQKN